MYSRYRPSENCAWEEAGKRKGRPAPAPKKKNSAPLDFDASDILLLLVLYFLYRESGDEEFLIILAVTAFSILGDGEKMLDRHEKRGYNSPR